ncbi:transcriptional regulator [Sphingomonas sp. RP10(2022)]|uniref:Transcriptional regulator n=1 Tax=Sphingomonas liriopis TaxID=2949094 RepID=A0A9X2HSR8_9SPHN|nr:transcriptional regulator [Sphingomonas liriopis]MCP3734789.1 transcriptional regulator [Sphingomonas liriopis]
MFVFLDFEASSLAKKSYPIEVAWVFEDGAHESHLIRPPLQWDDWDDAAEAIHHIPRALLEAEGTPHDVVARRMVAVLTGHQLFASAPSWDGKWLSALLRAAKLPRHALRLRDSDEAQRETATAILRGHVPEAELGRAVADVAVLGELRDHDVPAHRALADARDEWRRWSLVKRAAEERAAANPSSA